MPDSDERAGTTVTLTGIAGNGAYGAFVYVDERPYYIAGLHGFDDDTYGKRITVTGVLRVQRAHVEEDEPPGEHTHGLTGDALVIEDPTWVIEPDTG
jgi:hypothetical protein